MLKDKIYNITGDLRGYDRSRIRHDAAQRSTLQENPLADFTDQSLSERLGLPDVARLYGRDEITCTPENAREHLASLPVTTKHDLRTYLTKYPPPADSIPHSTGGSSGEPFRFLITRESYEWRRAVSDRGYAMAACSPASKTLYIWGEPIRAAAGSQAIKTRLSDWWLKRTFVPSFMLSESVLEEACRAINAFRPATIVGYSGCLVELARYAEKESGRLKHRCQSIITAAEGITPEQRPLLTRALGGEVFASYGSREFMLIGMECREHKGYHLNTDNLYVEVLRDDGTRCEAGELGQIAITDLHNTATPFIRYLIGDQGAMASSPCACGLPFPLLKSLDGRTQDNLLIPDKGLLSTLFIPHLLKEIPDLAGYQVVQAADKSLTLRLLSDSLRKEDEELLYSQLQKHCGTSLPIIIRCVNQLEQLPNGKTPVVIHSN